MSFDALPLRHASAAFQRKMRAHPDGECQIEHNLPPLTEEEMGDNFAWKARIPAATRWHVATSSKISTIASIDITCFRCNTQTLEGSTTTTDVLSCHDCRSAWRSDVLGYAPVDYYTNELVKMLDEDALEEMAGKMSLLAMEDDPERLQNVESWANEKWGTEVTL
jgi:transcription elongation factor Elf1